MSIEAETNLTFAAFQYLKGDYKKNGDRQESQFRLHIRKEFFSMKLVRYWHKLSRETVDAPFLETFKTRLDGL